jgi:ribosomal protein L17
VTQNLFDALAPLYRERARLLNRILRGEATQEDRETLERVRAELEDKEAATMRKLIDGAHAAFADKKGT